MKARAAFFAFGLVVGIVATLAVGEYNGSPAATMTPTAGTTPYFTSDTNVIPAGGCVTLSWSVPGAAQVTLTGSNWPEAAQEIVRNTGTTQVCPSAAIRYVPGEPVHYTLNVRYSDARQETRTVTITYEDAVTAIPLPSPTTPLVIATFTPIAPAPGATTSQGSTPTPLPVIARYQPFERGFMVQRAGEGCVLVFSTQPTENGPTGSIVIPRARRALPFGEYNYCTPFDKLPENSIGGAPPAGLLMPGGVFGQIWGYYEEVRGTLGYATEKDRLYMAPLPLQMPGISGAPWATAIVTLPDGRVLSCGYRAATAGWCSAQ